MSRRAFADTLKVLLVVGVIVGHAAMAYTENDAWLLDEPPVRDPLESVLSLAAIVGVLFAMATFFFIAGSFTPKALARKGFRRFVVDRTVRLGGALLVYVVLISPAVEYADSQDNAGWDKGFLAFVPHAWRQWLPGPLWFIEVLLLFSVGYAVLRTWRPAAHAARMPNFVAIGIAIAVASYLLRIVLPLGNEIEVAASHDIYWGQAPTWLAAFALGVSGAERGWLERLPADLSRRFFRVAMTGVVATVVIVSVVAGILGNDVDTFLGNGSVASLVLAVIEGAVAVAMPIWLYDVFRRRVTRQGPTLRAASRAAFGAYVLHQPVLLAAIVGVRGLAVPPEVRFLVASTLGVVGSFGAAWLLVLLRRAAARPQGSSTGAGVPAPPRRPLATTPRS